MILVAGHCPMGCGERLILDERGMVTCCHADCPQPDAAAVILDDGETGHIVTIAGDGSFTLRHPLRERLGDALMSCGLFEYMRTVDTAPVAPGRYRVTVDRPDGGLVIGWEKTG